MTDDYGRKIKVGDRLSLTVGMPGREVVVTVEDRRGRLVVTNDDGRMTLASALRYFPAEIMTR